MIHDPDIAVLMQHRWERAVAGHQEWAEIAKTCIEFVEGKQWSDDDLQAMKAARRPAMTFNHVRAFIKLVEGYMAQNRTDIIALPGAGAEVSTAEAISKLFKQIGSRNGLKYVDADVFFHGMATGRAYWDARLDFDDNDLGETKIVSADPFTTYVDPDLTDYDLNKGQFIFKERWVSIEEIEFMFGKDAAGALRTFGPVETSGQLYADRITPWRGFGGNQGDDTMSNLYEKFANHFDPARKTVRLLDMQHYVWTMRDHFVDLETGDREPVPEHWSKQRIMRALDIARDEGKAWTIRKRRDRRVRWTMMAGDIALYDQWSPYRQFTLVGFFPYFRGGKTRGMVEDLLDPQREINKRMSSMMDIVNRTANSGWKVRKGSLDEDGLYNLKRFGSTPGVVIEWEGESEPRQIDPVPPPTAMERLEQKSEDHLRKISGLNDSNFGHLDRVQSGKAVLARQKQGIIGLQPDLENFARSKDLLGRKMLEVIQNHYSETRVYRIRGEGNSPEEVVINQKTAEGIVNDVTAGKFDIHIDTRPAAETFEESQTEEVMQYVERGLIGQESADLILGMSSLPNKEEFQQRARMRLEAQGVVQAMQNEPKPVQGGRQ